MYFCIKGYYVSCNAYFQKARKDILKIFLQLKNEECNSRWHYSKFCMKTH